MFKNSLTITEKPTLKYPRAVGYIISNEFCERFNYYGMRTILVLYLTSKLHYDDDNATVLFHVFTMLVYLCPLIGAIIADSWLGKFKTILYLSMVYALGGIILSMSAVPSLNLPSEKATIAGLVLIAIGTGGIKPCVSAFGGDQFKLPEQAKQLATFFSMFYFTINAGSMISTSLTPILREDVHCFGDKDCFSLAFGVPALLMVISIIVFAAGKHLYVMKPPAGNMIFGVSQCIVEAIRGWRSHHKLIKREHWLDYAEPVVGQRMVTETKTLLKILVLFLPFPVFWALFDQQGSRWTFQATRMDGELLGFTIKPDQMQVINPLMILAFIPIFDYGLYPMLKVCGIRRPLQKLTLGGLLAATAFLFSAILELKLEALEPVLPTSTSSQLRIYNGMPCQYRFDTNLPMTQSQKESNLTPLGLWELTNIAAPQFTSYKFDAHAIDGPCPSISGELNIIPDKAVSYFIADDSMHEFQDNPAKPKLGNPHIRVLLNVPHDMGNFSAIDSADVVTPLTALNSTQVVTVTRGEVIITFNDLPLVNVSARAGGVYAVMIRGNTKDGLISRVHEITSPNSLHIMWQLPQITIITAAEIMFSITGLEFSFTQAPQSMKSVLQACWLLSVAIGNMLVVVIAESKFFQSQAAEFLLFSGLMIVDILIFMVLAMRYKYVESVEDIESNADMEIKETQIPPSPPEHDKSGKKRRQSPTKSKTPREQSGSKSLRFSTDMKQSNQESIEKNSTKNQKSMTNATNTSQEKDKKQKFRGSGVTNKGFNKTEP